MKPIQLKLAGLQSYREPQEVDFTRLCDSGVFGIFGPTGSGKSTILDAITLALYGKVERASGGTQGIMNQAESSLSVSFTFELSGAGSELRYTVERQFKRTGDASISGTVTRLIETTPIGQIVLADKAREVDAAVQDILGLSMIDFTRAVVLPQGKFAEFLSLTGKDRRQMLQRLFRLEHYGDRLMARLAAETNRAKTDIGRVESEQLGLGDASEIALETARQTAKGALSDLERSTLAFKNEQASFTALQQAWDRWRERDALRGQWDALTLKSSDILSKERSLMQAERAESVRTLYEEWLNAERNARARQTAKEDAEHKRAVSETTQSNAKALYESNRQARLEHEPPLEKRITELKQAVSVEAELSQWRSEAKATEQRLLEARETLTHTRTELAQARDRSERAVTRQNELKAQLSSTDVASELRQRVQAAYSDRLELRALYSQVKEQEATAAELLAELTRLRDFGSSLREQQTLSRVQGTAMAEALQIVMRDWRHAETAIRALLLDIEKLRAERQHRQAAAILAIGLAAGEACPVCGSNHHPNPLKPAKLEDESAAASDYAEDEAVERLRELQLLLHQQRFRLEHAATAVYKLQANSSIAPAGIQPEEAVSVNEAAAAIAQKDLGLENEEFLYRTDTMEYLVEQVGQAVSACEKQIEQAANEAFSVTEELQGTEVRVQSLEQQWSQANRKLEFTRNRVQQAEEQWQTRYGDWTTERVDEEQGRIQQQDQLAEELRSRLVKSEPFIAELNESIHRLQEQEANADKASAQLEAQLEGHSRLTSSRLELLSRLLSGTDLKQASGFDELAGQAARLLGQSERELAQLRQEESASLAAMEKAAAEWHSAVQTVGIAIQAYESAVEMSAQAQARLERAMNESGFADPEELQASLVPEAQKQQWHQEVQVYRDREKELQLRLKLLEDQLQGIILTEAEFKSSNDRLHAVKEQYEAALQKKAKAERDQEELEGKHARWKQLEESRAALQQRLQSLSKLTTVFRGNAFVEFVAEEQLAQICRSASERLSDLTRRRYALEIDSGGGFVIRDDANGGVRRPVSSLSGGETFLASLSLALALSAQIQLRGQYPLEFFFLDEGFGTLDPELLDTVITALEKLHTDRLSVGVISHVPELRARLPRRLIIQPAQTLGTGSRVELETM
jgi:DNA repair protein SbcC/Rad50